MKHQSGAVAAAFSLALSGAAAAGGTFEDLAMAQLACGDAPDPLPVLEALEAMGKLDLDDMTEMDSITCFAIPGGLDLAGLPVIAVCAHEERSALRAKRPDLLKRGPGTSPGQHLSFGTSAPESDARAWYVRHFGEARLSGAIETEFNISGAPVELACSAWISG